MGCKARVLCLYLSTSCLSFLSVLFSYNLLLPVSVNRDLIPGLMPLRFTFSVFALFTCISFFKFLIKFSIFDDDVKKKKKKRKKR